MSETRMSSISLFTATLSATHHYPHQDEQSNVIATMHTNMVIHQYALLGSPYR